MYKKPNDLSHIEDREKEENELIKEINPNTII